MKSKPTIKETTEPSVTQEQVLMLKVTTDKTKGKFWIHHVPVDERVPLNTLKQIRTFLGDTHFKRCRRIEVVKTQRHITTQTTVETYE